MALRSEQAVVEAVVARGGGRGLAPERVCLRCDIVAIQGRFLTWVIIVTKPAISCDTRLGKQSTQPQPTSPCLIHSSQINIFGTCLLTRPGTAPPSQNLSALSNSLRRRKKRKNSNHRTVHLCKAFSARPPILTVTNTSRMSTSQAKKASSLQHDKKSKFTLPHPITHKPK